MRTREENIELIKTLSNANGVSGFEDEVAEIGRKETEHYCNVTIDSLRNTYMSLKNNKGRKLKVWMDAHSDEVGYIVQAIKPNGTMNFLTLGGSEVTNLPSNKVRVRNDDGEYIPGIITSKPPHFISEAEKGRGRTLSDMAIDVGAVSTEDLKKNFNIRMAAPVVPDVECTYDEKRDLFMGKAFDCRVGCAALIEALNQLSKEELEVDVEATLTVQEEVGERGAMAAVDNIDADVCIVFEGCPADDTFSPDYMIQTALRKGPMLRHFDCSMITNPRFQRFALDLGEELGIPVQESVRSGGGTNGKYIHASRHGVPTIVIGVPVRYIHSHYGICTLEDYQNSVRLAVEIVKHLNEETIGNF
ncbi:M42 family metallopeptidase [Coprococcus sp. AF21-14LB]|uniref:M42 family metallopeptidase n=1 Tax=Coprococcus sp. AF21-14LB TaxID=2292231 RepID=UPI000E549826|nr:M20/M25/M40 family metallo-hydrolase [Coprococcus sp. AF21-14LB]RGS80565.1 M42 family peptidase [Coprococcus sp. AF21-14LB]